MSEANLYSALSDVEREIYDLIFDSVDFRYDEVPYWLPAQIIEAVRRLS